MSLSSQLCPSQVSQEVVFEKTFDGLIPSDCFWTLENSNCVSLYLTKKNEGTRWTHVWLSDDGILETLDASQLDAYTQALSKFTDSTPSTEIYQKALSEKAEEEDFQGPAVRLSLFNIEGQRIGQVSCSGHEWIGQSLIPWHDSICLSYDMDGLLFTCQRNEQGHLELAHKETFPALSFVTASKRDRRLVGVSLDKAFIVESKQVYVYDRGVKGQTHSSQALVPFPEAPVQVRGGWVLQDRLLIAGTRELLLI